MALSVALLLLYPVAESPIRLDRILVVAFFAALGLSIATIVSVGEMAQQSPNGIRDRIVRRSDNGQVSTLVTGQAEPTSVAVDARAVFWTADTGLYTLQR